MAYYFHLQQHSWFHVTFYTNFCKGFPFSFEQGIKSQICDYFFCLVYIFYASLLHVQVQYQHSRIHFHCLFQPSDLISSPAIELTSLLHNSLECFSQLICSQIYWHQQGCFLKTQVWVLTPRFIKSAFQKMGPRNVHLKRLLRCYSFTLEFENLDNFLSEVDNSHYAPCFQK